MLNLGSRAIIAILIVVLIGTLARTAPATGQTAGQTLVVGVEGLAPRMDGFFVTAQSWIFTNLIFDALFRVDNKGNITPGLAVAWKMTSPTKWVINLRRGVTFHNGEKFDAADVKFTLDHWLKPANGYNNLNRIEGVTGVKILDDLTIQLTTSVPFPLLPGRFTTVFIWPSKTFAQVGAAAFQKAPVGTGRFKVVEFALDDRLSLAANDNYWGGRPTIDALRFVLQPEAASRVAALEAGEIQIAQAVPVDQKKRLESKAFRVVAVPIGQSFIIHFNVLENSIPPLLDRRVRQAINYAIDKDAIVKELTGGLGRKLDGQLVGPDGVGYCPAVKAYPYNPEKAKALLKAAGYGNGFSVKYMFGHPRYYRGKEVAETVAEYLRQVGINVQLQVLEFGKWVDIYFEGKAGPITHVGGNYLPGMDFADVAALMRGDVPEHFWQNKKFDRLFKVYSSRLKLEERQRIACEISALVKEEAAVVPLFQIPAIFGVAPNVKGVVFLATGLIDFDHASMR